jgi:hypothetical protein
MPPTSLNEEWANEKNPTLEKESNMQHNHGSIQ